MGNTKQQNIKHRKQQTEKTDRKTDENRHKI